MGSETWSSCQNYLKTSGFTDWAHAFTVRGGKVVKLQEYIDTSAVVAELNVAQART